MVFQLVTFVVWLLWGIATRQPFWRRGHSRCRNRIRIKVGAVVAWAGLEEQQNSSKNTIEPIKAWCLSRASIKAPFDSSSVTFQNCYSLCSFSYKAMLWKRRTLKNTWEWWRRLELKKKFTCIVNDFMICEEQELQPFTVYYSCPVRYVQIHQWHRFKLTLYLIFFVGCLPNKRWLTKIEHNLHRLHASSTYGWIY